VAEEKLIIVEEDATNAVGFRIDDINDLTYEERQSGGLGTIQLLNLELGSGKRVSFRGAEAVTVYATIKDSFSEGGADASPAPIETTQASILTQMELIDDMRDALSSVAGGVFMRIGTDGVPLKVTITGIDHNILDGDVHGDSVADAVTQGSLVVGNATPKWDELILGADNDVLASDGSDLAYETLASLLKATLLTSDGDLLVRTGGNVTRLAAGAADELLAISGGDPTWVNKISRKQFITNYPTYFKDWRDLVGFTEAHSGTGAFTAGFMFGTIKTGTTLNSEGIIHSTDHFWVLTGTTAFITQLLTRINIDTVVTNSLIWIGMFDNQTAPTATEEHIGWKILNGDLFASCGNGSDGNLEDTGVDIVAFGTYDLYIKNTPNKVEYYVSNVLKATFETNLPTSGFELHITYYVKTTDTVSKQFKTFPFWLTHGPNVDFD